jgi:hypothetical protein
MQIEDIAKLDLYLRSENGIQNLLDVDDLIVVKNDIASLSKFKDAAYRLKNVDYTAAEKLKVTWEHLFPRQVRYSIDRANNKVNKK